MNDVWSQSGWVYEDWAQRGELWQLGQVSDGLAEGEVEVEVEGRICTPLYPEAFGRGLGSQAEVRAREFAAVAPETSTPAIDRRAKRPSAHRVRGAVVIYRSGSKRVVAFVHACIPACCADIAAPRRFPAGSSRTLRAALLRLARWLTGMADERRFSPAMRAK